MPVFSWQREKIDIYICSEWTFLSPKTICFIPSSPPSVLGSAAPPLQIYRPDHNRSSRGRRGGFAGCVNAPTPTPTTRPADTDLCGADPLDIWFSQPVVTEELTGNGVTDKPRAPVDSLWTSGCKRIPVTFSSPE